MVSHKSEVRGPKRTVFARSSSRPGVLAAEIARFRQNDFPNKNGPIPNETGRGTLRNGNPSGDFSKAARCGAENRRGTPCKCPAIPNGRCRLHGGLSTGPKTPTGILARCGKRSPERLYQRIRERERPRSPRDFQMSKQVEVQPSILVTSLRSLHARYSKHSSRTGALSEAASALPKDAGSDLRQR
jgi:hypothetical protein